MDDLERESATIILTSPRTRRRPGLLTLVSALLAMFSWGCSQNKQDINQDIVSFLKAHEHVVSGNNYILAPPDVITVHAPVSPEINSTSHRIDPEGKITLKLLGEVKVAGLTPREAAEKIQLLLDRYYVDPEVGISITGYSSKSIYVLGEVQSSGVYAYTGRDTLMDILAKANPTFLAWRAKIEVIRPDPVSTERKKLVIDLDKMIRDGDPTMNILLQEGDTVYVPPTPLAWVGLRMRELFFPVEPALRAYQLPAEPMATTDYYTDRDDDDDNGDHSRRISILRRY